MRKASSLAITSLIFISALCFTKANAQVSLPWMDDFDYYTNSEMTNAGWTLEGGEHLIAVGDGTVTLTNDGVSGPGISYKGEFPSGIYDFVAETSAKRTDSTSCGIGIDIYTETYYYSAGADGATNDYRLIREGPLLLKDVDGYTAPLNVWEKVTLERTGNVFRLFIDDELKLTYEETDDTPSPVTGIGVHSGWLATIKYEYISLKTQKPSNISLTPSTGFAVTTVAGSGFSSNSKVTITWDDMEIPTVPSPITTDSDGDFTAIISVFTQNETGLHTIEATDEWGKTANATFDVINIRTSRDQSELSFLVDAFTIGVSIIAICLATIAVLKGKNK